MNEYILDKIYLAGLHAEIIHWHTYANNRLIALGTPWRKVLLVVAFTEELAIFLYKPCVSQRLVTTRIGTDKVLLTPDFFDSCHIWASKYDKDMSLIHKPITHYQINEPTDCCLIIDPSTVQRIYYTCG